MLTIGRDPFARETTSAELVLTRETCAWCGSPGRPCKTDPSRHYLRRYRVTSDSGRSGYVAGARLFCSIGCARSWEC